MGRILERWRKVDGVLRAGGWAWTIFGWVTGLTSAAVIAWASTTWAWYWTTFSWAGVAVAFLTAFLILATSFLLIALAVRALRRPGGEIGRGDITPPDNKPPKPEMLGRPTLRQLPPALATGLYVSDISFNFDDLKNNRRGELTMRVFNGAGRAVEFAKLSGQITFNAPNNTDPARKGVLPTPTLRHDVSKTAHVFQEWFFIFEQHVPAEQADKLLTMLRDDVPIHFELTGLNISVFAHDDPKKIERLPLWYGLSCRRGICFGRIIAASVRIG